MTSSKALLLMLMLIGCPVRSREEAVLAPIGVQFAQGTYDEGNQPLYLLLADPLTASVLRDVTWKGRYRIAPSGSPLFCPLTPGEGLHGYQLSLRIDTLMGDSAIASVRRFCTKSNRVISTGEHILLVRQRTNWTIGRVLDGWESALGFLPLSRLRIVAA